TDYKDSAADDAERRLSSVVRLTREGAQHADAAFRRAAAQIQDDGAMYQSNASEGLLNVARKIGHDVESISSNIVSEDTDRDNTLHRKERRQLPYRTPAFPVAASFVQLLSGLRAASHRSEDWDGILLSLSYRLPEMMENGKEEEARRLLRFFARHVSVLFSDVHPLAKLAEALENANCQSLAALAYSYAYLYTRGRSGWGSIGDEASRHLMQSAIRLFPDAAREVLANEVSYRLREEWYSL